MLLSPLQRRRLARARDLLGEPGAPAPSIAHVAREAGLSTFQFIRQFEAVFGETPHQFRIRSRLERARELLVLGDLPVTEICLEVGFSSLGSFSDLFARRVGAPPSAYRRRVRALVQVPADLVRVIAPGCFGLMTHLPASAFRNFREAPSAAPVVSVSRPCRT